MSESDERFYDPAERADGEQAGPEVEGHRMLRNEEAPVEGEDKVLRGDDDGPEVEGHAVRDAARDSQAARKIY